MTFIDYRSTLESTVDDHLAFVSDADVSADPIKGVRAQLDEGELSVAVVGEINRGKSTFLNALMGEEVFPSRTMVCTAGVTVLDHGEEPRAEVIYKDDTTEEIDLSGTEPAQALKEVVSRSNKDVQDIQVTRVWYPNPFTGNGLVLVDTPGVNDPDHWREEITYSYLAEADAVIMLLDPMQPLSASETEFLDSKILDRSISNLIFVVNKIDDVPRADREDALERVEEILSEHVPNPTVYPVAAKPALEAKQTGDEDKLKGTGMPEFEKGLMDFLAKGRGGLLLRTKVQKGLDHLAHIQDTVQQRRAALDAEKGEVEKRLSDAREQLDRLSRKRDSLEDELEKQQSQIERNLKQVARGRSDYLNNSLKPAVAGESDAQALQDRALRFQRDSIAAFRGATEDAFDKLLDEYDATSVELAGEVRDVLSDLSREASNRAQSMRVEREERRPDQSDLEERKTGAAVGASAGAAAGAAVAGELAAIGTIGAGILTGGLGLVVGAGAAALLSNSGGEDEQQSGTQYVNTEEMVNNEQAVKALDGFIDRLVSSAGPVSKGIVESAKDAVLGPIDQSIQDQRRLLRQIQEDLRQTEQDQQSTRDDLRNQEEEVEALQARYSDLMAEIEEMAAR
ncbi:GTPase Era involved in 16S rRNA processing/archaellum component FlaC [Salinibacter ruber]|nr:dynamin family protein [Salinibacter ruber]MCS3682616.1 GTPase Era involved in 16S rRNA processing/archaellum component FlaC [Salinibacter ruber]